MEPERPDPDVLLQQMRAEEARSKRTKLKVFFGFAPGVGKTYAMLESARRLREEGVDVVVGCVETHGREETAALVEGLEILPRKIVLHRGATLTELDVEAAVARKPAVLLVDELAHTNAPGVRHAKRWQDVLDLLDAGIEVHTTLNVQHVESLNDVIAQVTQVRVRETVPDVVLDRADEIELIDIPPEDLLERLEEGKVYLGEAAARAAQSFFKRGNLLALREIALRRTAERVDADVQAYREEHGIREPWAATERILVCVGPAPASARLVRAARRMAGGLKAPWVAASVDATTSRPLSPADAQRLDSHLRMAESLGAQVVHLTGTRVSEALLDYARKHSVTRIILGKPTHSRLRDVIRGSLLEEVVRGSGTIDVLVISGDEPDAGPAPPAGPPSSTGEIDLRGYLWAAGLVTAATLLSLSAGLLVAPPDIVMIYLLVIMVVAVLHGRGPAVAASALSVAAYDFCFVPPYYTFAVSDTRHLLTFATMFVVGIVMSALAVRVRAQQQEAMEREEKTALLYALSREISTALDETEIAMAIARHASQLFSAPAAVLPARGVGEIGEPVAVGEVPLGTAEMGVVRWVLQHGRIAGLGTDTVPGARVLCVPLRSGSRVLGVLALAPRTESTSSHRERSVLDAFVQQGALALERARLSEEAKAAVLKARTEEMRSSLLSAVSHDLRTPLAAITGAASALRDPGGGLDADQRADLVITIGEEAERLERLVANLLDMTRLESGALVVKRDWVPLEEIVGAAATRLEAKLRGRTVSVSLPLDLPLLSVDPVLLEQVFVNLLENAVRHTLPGSPIDVAARRDDEAVVVEVSDRGPGIPSGDEERVFEKFYRGPAAPGGGVGLGLAICRGIAEAHGGTLKAEARPGGGSTFRLRLPLEKGAPVVPSDGEIEARTETPG